MGHMNVRFYVNRSVDGLASYSQLIGLGPKKLNERGQTLAIKEMHIRFHREMHPGTPFLMRAGVVAANTKSIRLFQEISNLMSGEVSATFVIDVSLTDQTSRELVDIDISLIDKLKGQLITLPKHAAARGTSTEAPRQAPTLQEADSLSLFEIYRGVVASNDVDEQGYMQAQGFMGAMSNGITHLFMALKDQGKPREQGMGGAALEYRFVFKQSPRIGDIVVVRSGLKGMLGKASNLCHWLFDGETGECIATAENVAVSFDLKTRKAIEPPADIKAQMMAKAIPELSV